MRDVVNLTRFLLSQMTAARPFFLLVLLATFFWGLFLPRDLTITNDYFQPIVGTFFLIYSAATILLTTLTAYDHAILPLVVLVQRRSSLLGSVYASALLCSAVTLLLFCIVGRVQYPLLTTFQIVAAFGRALHISIVVIAIVGYTTRFVGRREPLRRLLIGVLIIICVSLMVGERSGILYAVSAPVRLLVSGLQQPIGALRSAELFAYLSITLFAVSTSILAYQDFQTKDLHFPEKR